MCSLYFVGVCMYLCAHTHSVHTTVDTWCTLMANEHALVENCSTRSAEILQSQITPERLMQVAEAMKTN